MDGQPHVAPAAALIVQNFNQAHPAPRFADLLVLLEERRVDLLRDRLTFACEGGDTRLYIRHPVLFGLGHALELRFQIFDVAAQTVRLVFKLLQAQSERQRILLEFLVAR